MNAALIGHTGFVGSNLLAQTGFSHRFNRANIVTIAQQPYDVVVCAGVQATKWWANKHPEEDRAGIAALQENLKNVKTERFILISTIDVFEDSRSRVDEFTSPPVPRQAYGAHRLQFEEWVKDRFSNTLIIRLPALYGPGLKKNILFDLLTNNQTSAIVPNTIFQWYDVRNLWHDIGVAEKAGLCLIHLMPEPLQTSRMLATCFPDVSVGELQSAPAHYDICTKSGTLFGGNGHYIQTAGQSLAAISDFVADVRKGRISLAAGATT